MDAITSDAADLLGVEMVALQLVDTTDPNLMVTVSGGIINDLKDEPSAIAAPVHLDGEPSGTLLVGSAGGGRAYTQDEQDILIAFAEHASLAVNAA